MLGFNAIKKSDYKEDIDKAVANFQTSAGNFEVELYVKKCPTTVWNFINLAEGRQETKKGGAFYEGIIFHRVIDGFMIQAGCPEGMGSGGPGYSFEDEIGADNLHSTEGILSMANRGPNTNGSQFFITLAPVPHLNKNHTVFGKVINGMEVVKKIGSTAVGAQSRPTQDIVIQKITITR